MKDIKKIIKAAIKNLTKNDKLPTPEYYEKEFFNQAKLFNYQFNEQNEFENIFKSLSEEEQIFIRENNITTFYELTFLLLKRVKNRDIINFLEHLDYFLIPSIDHNIEDRIKILKEELLNEPEKLVKNSTINRLRKFTTERIQRDKVVVQEKAKDVKKVISLMGKYFDKCILQSDDTSRELKMIKSELEALELSEHSARDIAMIQSRLIDSVYKLENNIEDTQKELFKGQKDCVYLQKQVNKLQKELDEVSHEKDIDFLTGINNRRAFISEIDKIENEYEIFKSKYAIIFYDIDHFKSINDNYGFDCGDTVLSTFATILKKLTREEDVVCRYASEKFVSLIHYTQENEVITYLKRVQNIISTNKFVHKDIKLKVKFCASLAFRNKYASYKEAIEYAEILLNKAKHEGRNKIILDTGFCL
ncbi:GGDEF domain-containing protein [Malaciobacter molluscorum LMG 25693]|uniref:diguanylate cyclase n=1 Tax=Malaciobacter molluscorum LMG 25693 TaxID=870501 RepID=A0A2G1DIJ2_9BACT|nr:diguanylate cyclase [Malaciobacter molluscorum]AXX91851.1 diguanylate cyclase [Malaciobacter molluscorum LMG 25693]PHO18260.1 GGDEF domain-containing protein [Malaciobacter molluscorum LMG 25693]RXJ94143.1 GGDEF domain-containing protein [Malaciobacter molluscorum]